MPALDELLRAAYKTELVLCRRLMRNQGLAQREALMQVLERHGVPLPQLLAGRAQAKAEEAVRKALRRQQKEEALAQKRADHTNPTAWQAWFDGSARPNPGRIGIGGILRNPAGELFEHCAAAGHGDSNQAEYLALIAILEKALQLNAAPLIVCGDSRVVIDSLRSASHAGTLSAYHARARALLAQLPNVTLRWIPRHRNAVADALSQRAFGDAGVSP
ncbi:reverse transcriptase-like protein [Oxalobacteraceae bacterium CAVE-383]|nr:reverse transcriptase-like protein [Oxalobacteraceae bacterium CAVE-383]